MKTVSNKPELLEGGFAVDDRGQVSFANGFNFPGIKRFYVVENFSSDLIRAFHGHLKEDKYIFPISGSAIIAAVYLDNIKKPNKKNEVHRFLVSARKPALLKIPAKHANGIKVLEPGTKLIIFSTTTLEEAKGDDYRFPHDYWGNKVWEIEHR
ncbi:MAG: sugar epimerase [Candidatus Yanofskybacteria bacterium]|nr:sugar epimerase [Candidatus Yanofskybacteria bacterium]